MLTLLGGHGHPVTLVVACAALVAGPSVATWLWWRQLKKGSTGVSALSAARRELRLAVGGAGILTVAFAFLSYVAIWGQHVGVFGLSLSEGHVIAALPLLAASAALGLQDAGERFWPSPTGRHRDATLVAREPATLGDMRPIVWSFTSLIVVVLALALAASGPRAISKIEGQAAETITPFPGWLWALPSLAAAALAALLLRRAVRAVAERPAVPEVSPAWDTWLRRQVARRLILTMTMICGLTTAGILTIAGTSLHLLGRGFANAGGTSDVGYQVAGVALQALGLLMALAALWTVSRRSSDSAPRPWTRPAVASQP